MNFSSRPRRLPRLAASAVALLTATGLALASPPTVSAQQAPSLQTDQPAQTAQSAPPLKRTDTTPPAAPMPADAMPALDPQVGIVGSSPVENGVVDIKPDSPAPPLPFDPNQPAETMPLRPGDENSGRVGRTEPSLRALRAGCRDFYNPNRDRTYTVCGDILTKYEQLGGPGGALGLPITDELRNPDGAGMRTAFENDSSIYWHPNVGAFQIGGAIGVRWGYLGYENSPLGYPTTDEFTNPDGVGKRNWFQGGAIYWHQATGAWEIWGEILNKWAADGYEADWGYPIGPEIGPGATPESAPSYGGYSQEFHNGTIYWNLVPPACGGLTVDNVHDSFRNPGTLNVHGGLPRDNRCNRRVKTMGFEMRMWDHGSVGLPNLWQLHQDWTTPDRSPFGGKFFLVTNVTGGPCAPKHGHRMSADVRGYMIDYDGTSYALPLAEGPFEKVTCQ